MRTVYEAANIIDAHLVRQALEAEGIPAYVRGEALIGGIGELGVYGLLGVMVPELALPQAREIVEALGFGESAAAVSDAEALPGALQA